MFWALYNTINIMNALLLSFTALRYEYTMMSLLPSVRISFPDFYQSLAWREIDYIISVVRQAEHREASDPCEHTDAASPESI